MDPKEYSYWADKGVKKCIPELPNISPFKGETFYKHYDLLSHEYFRIGEGTRKRKFFGNSKDQICAICEGKSPTVTFRNRSHIIPESLGNKIFFSKEECDSCNDKYGQQFENEIAKYFLRIRIWKGIKGGNSNPKLKLEGGGEITYKDLQGFVATESNSGGIIIDKDKNEIKLKIIPIKVKRGKVILSVLKTAWLFLSSQDRKNYPKILDTIIRSLDSKLVYYELTYPGEITHPSFYIYKRKDDRSDIPRLIIRFDFIEKSIFWGYPEENANIVFPETFFLKNKNLNNSINLSEYTIDDIEKEIDLYGNTWTFGFSALEENTPTSKPLMVSPVNHNLPKFPCSILHGDSVIKTFATFYRYDFECTHATIYGNGLPAAMEIYMNHHFTTKDYWYRPSYRSTSNNKLVEYLEFSKKYIASNSKEIIISGNFFNFKLRDIAMGDPNPSKTLEYLSKLEKINEYFAKNLKLPDYLTQDDEITIDELGELLVTGSYSQKDHKITVSESKESLKDIINKLEEDKSKFGVYIDGYCTYKLFGHTLFLDKLDIDLSDVKKYKYEEIEPYINEKNLLIEANLEISFQNIIVKKR